VYYAGADQAWEYDNLTALWAADLDHNVEALATVKRGGYFSAQPVHGLTVLSLNINYWAIMNSQVHTNTTLAYAEGQAQFVWLATALAAAAARKDAVHILGHHPPTSEPGAAAWLPG
jgi:3',5'-cyclic AMP phosphodiesterase CpdA